MNLSPMTMKLFITDARFLRNQRETFDHGFFLLLGQIVSPQLSALCAGSQPHLVRAVFRFSIPSLLRLGFGRKVNDICRAQTVIMRTLGEVINPTLAIPPHNPLRATSSKRRLRTACCPPAASRPQSFACCLCLL